VADRDDVDALAAREAALSAEVAAKQAERDEAARLLAEAKGEAPPAAPTPRRTAVLAVGVGLALATGAVAFAVNRSASDVGLAREPMGVKLPPLTCAQVEPAHEATERDTNAAYEAALAAKGLHRAPLASGLPTTFGTREELDEAVGQRLPSWEPVRWHGHTVIADEVYDERVYGGRDQAEFVADDHGDVWRVVRVPHVRFVSKVTVEACSWGCWGGPPSGMEPPPSYGRDIWVLPDGAHYRGELEISYDAPSLDIEHVDLGCAAPA
jgi:hypothetical protein